jgi:hypothetical protein
MRCSGSQTTSTVPDRTTVTDREHARPQAVFAALVFADVLKPLCAALGPLGETLASTVAERAFLGRTQ